MRVTKTSDRKELWVLSVWRHYYGATESADHHVPLNHIFLVPNPDHVWAMSDQEMVSFSALICNSVGRKLLIGVSNQKMLQCAILEGQSQTCSAVEMQNQAVLAQRSAEQCWRLSGHEGRPEFLQLKEQCLINGRWRKKKHSLFLNNLEEGSQRGEMIKGRLEMVREECRRREEKRKRGLKRATAEEEECTTGGEEERRRSLLTPDLSL